MIICRLSVILLFLVKISQLVKKHDLSPSYTRIQKCQTRNYNVSIVSLFTKEKGFK